MKVWLDDERPAPSGWTPVRWPTEAIKLLQTGRVDEISLDHDLGDDRRGTGYDVVLWIEEAVVTKGFTPPKVINVHSANPAGRRKMEQGIQQIYRLHQRFSQPSASRVASFYLTAQRPQNTILVNVWDDSPPGAPIYIEGQLPEDAEFTKEQVYNWLAGVVQGAGYGIKTEGGFGWGFPVHFKVKHPTMATYNDAVDNEAHHEFLQGLVDLLTDLEYGGYKLYVVSES